MESILSLSTQQQQQQAARAQDCYWEKIKQQRKAWQHQLNCSHLP
jgi:hypothetical protein